MDKIITKNKSRSIKFLAVCLMITYHLFAFPARIMAVSYNSLFEIGGQTIEFYISRAGGICVGMFTFLSGYGLYISYNKNISYKGILKRIYNFYKKYWLVFFIFILGGFVLGKYKFNLTQFILNFIGLEDSYNGEWWYVRLYIMLLVSYPMINKILDRYNYKFILIISFLINIGGYGITTLSAIFNIKLRLLALLALLLGGQFLFILGVVIAKYGLFNSLNEKINIKRKTYIYLSIVTFFIIVFIGDIPVFGEIAKLILIPIFVFTLVNAIKDESCLSKLGRHSTNMWLTHSFFCYYYFQRFTFILKYPILILLQLIVITIIVSIILEKIEEVFLSKLNIFNRKIIWIEKTLNK